MTPACIADPVLINVQIYVCSHPVCIGGLAFIRRRQIIQQIWYTGSLNCELSSSLVRSSDYQGTCKGHLPLDVQSRVTYEVSISCDQVCRLYIRETVRRLEKGGRNTLRCVCMQ